MARIDTEALHDLITSQATADDRVSEFQSKVWSRVAGSMRSVVELSLTGSDVVRDAIDAVVPDPFGVESLVAFTLKYVARREEHIERLERRVGVITETAAGVIKQVEEMVVADTAGDEIDADDDAGDIPEPDSAAQSAKEKSVRGRRRMYRGLSISMSLLQDPATPVMVLGGDEPPAPATKPSKPTVAPNVIVPKHAGGGRSVTFVKSKGGDVAVDGNVLTQDIETLHRRVSALREALEDAFQWRPRRSVEVQAGPETHTRGTGSKAEIAAWRVLGTAESGVQADPEPCGHLLVQRVSHKLPYYRRDHWQRVRARYLFCKAMNMPRHAGNAAAAARGVVVAFRRYAAVCERQLGFIERVIDKDCRAFHQHGAFYAALLEDWESRRMMLTQRLSDALLMASDYLLGCSRQMHLVHEPGDALRNAAHAFADLLKHTGSPQMAGNNLSAHMMRQWEEGARRLQKRKPHLFVANLDPASVRNIRSPSPPLEPFVASPPGMTPQHKRSPYDHVRSKLHTQPALDDERRGEGRSPQRTKCWATAVSSSTSKWSHVAVSPPEKPRRREQSSGIVKANTARHTSPTRAQQQQQHAPSSPPGAAPLILPLLSPAPNSPSGAATARRAAAESRAPPTKPVHPSPLATSRHARADPLSAVDTTEADILGGTDRPSLPCALCVQARAQQRERACDVPTCCFGFQQRRAMLAAAKASQGTSAGSTTQGRKSVRVPNAQGADLSLGPEPSR